MLFSTLITSLLSLFIGIPITAVVLAFARVHENWEGRAFCGIAGFSLRLCGSCWVTLGQYGSLGLAFCCWSGVGLGCTGISCDSRAFIVVIVCGGEGGVGRVLDECALTGGLRLFDPTGLYVF